MLQSNQLLQNRYRIVKVLGRGGMGAVYEARHIKLDMVCVVKEMLPPGDPEQVEVLAKQFEREGKTLAGLRHPNLPRVSDYFSDSGNYYLVMDLISGQSLDKLIGPQGLPEATVLQYADQLLDVLAYVHAQGVLHRDIKPANIIVQPDGRVVLVDFGLVKVADGKMSSFSMRAMTPHYAPPEQYTGGTDQRSDLFSLAATLYQALSAQLPTSAADQFAGQPMLSLHQLRPEISINTASVIEKTLQLDRAKRCQSATEMRAVLRSAALKSTASDRTAQLGAAPAYDDPTINLASQRLPKPGTRRAPVPENPLIPRWATVTIGVIAVAILASLAVIIVPGLAPPSAPTALPTSLPAPKAVDVTRTPAPKRTLTPAPTDTPVPEATNTPLPPSTLPPTALSTALGDSLVLTLAPNVTLDLVRVPAGVFRMGSDDSDGAAKADEKPQSSLSLKEYLIGSFEVTVAQFAAFVNAAGYKTVAERQGSSWTFVGSQWQEVKGANWRRPLGVEVDLAALGSYPATHISWADAAAFCKWAGQAAGGREVRLPTEAEWEKAARGGDGRRYPWGNQPVAGDRVNFADRNLSVSWADSSADDGYQYTAPVGAYPSGKSPYGAFDMAGNVWEWTSSLYRPYPYRSDDGREDPMSSDPRVVRGGGFNESSENLRAAIRVKSLNNQGGFNVGFRVVVAPLP